MKKIFFLLVFLITPSIVAAQAINIYSRDSFTEGSGALTAINATTLKTGDIAYVKIQNDETYGTGLFIYFYVSDSGAEVSAPNVYKPAAGTTDGRWIRTIPYIEGADLKTMEVGTNPIPTSIYNLSMDTNGAAGTGDRVVRAIDGDGNQWPVGQRSVSIPIVFIEPQSFADDIRDKWEVWRNETGMTFTISAINCTADISTSIAIKTTTSISNSSISKTIGTVDINSERTGGGYYGIKDSGFTSTTVTAGEAIVLDFHDTHDPKGGECSIKGVFNAAVD